MAAMPDAAQLTHDSHADADLLAVRCRNVVKQFGKGDTAVFALRGVNFDVWLGEMTLLVGPSGCGKTTLLSVIAGILDPTDGEVHVLGTDVAALSNNQKVTFRGHNIGFVFQQYNLLPALTAAENVAVPLIIGGMHRRAAIEIAEDRLEQVGLADRIYSLPEELSGGQQQRVAIARALLARAATVGLRRADGGARFRKRPENFGTAAPGGGAARSIGHRGDARQPRVSLRRPDRPHGRRTYC